MGPSTILIIEDDVESRVLLKECLRLENFNVAEAADGLEAVHYLQANPDTRLVMMDLAIPKLNGEDLLKAIESVESSHRIPVILVSGSEGLSERARELGVDGYLMKPFQIDELLDLAKKFCRAENDFKGHPRFRRV